MKEPKRPKRCEGGCGRVLPKQGRFCFYCIKKQSKEYQKEYQRKYREKKKNEKL